MDNIYLCFVTFKVFSMEKTVFRSVHKIIIGLFILLSINIVDGQNINYETYPKVRFGGGIGLSFGSGYFSGTLAPSAIYQFNEQFALGMGLSGTYSSLKDRYTSTIVGASVIALYNVIPEIQLSAEFEELNVTRKYEYYGVNSTENYWYPGLFLGVGFHTGNVAVGIRYDVLYDREKSIYADAYVPFVRVYF